MAVRVEEHIRHRPDCPFCKGTIADGSQTWACSVCTTVHHADCARSNGRCTVLGCTGTVPPPPRPPRPAGVVRQTHQPGEVAAVVFVVAVCVAAAFWFLGGLFHGRRPADGAATRDVPEERGQLAAYWSLVDEIEGLVREVVVLDREKKPATGPYNLALERYAVAIQIRFEANAHLEDRLRRGWGSDWMGEREALLVLGALARGERRTP